MEETKLVVLDRDGVINFDSPDFIKMPEEWVPIPGSLEAIAQLNRAGFKVTVATNQSGVGRGLYTLEDVGQVHEKIQTSLKAVGGHIDGFFVCPHAPWESGECRKPKPGLLQQIADTFHVDFKTSKIPCIGDSLRDLQAAQAIGGFPILVLTGNGKKTAETLPSELKHIPQFDSLATAVTALVKPQ